MMKKILFSVIATTVLFSCSGKKENTQKKEGTIKVEYTYTDADREIPVTITTPPQRAAIFNPYTTEILLALGLEDRMVIGSTEGDVLPEFKEAYEKVPLRLIGHGFRMNKEEFLLKKPDFAAGNLSVDTSGDPQELLKRGIAPFNLKSLETPNATLDMVYDDINLIGRIFDVEDKANEVISNMKNKLAEAQKTFVDRPNDEKKKVLILSYKGGIGAFGSLVTDLINKAGGVNIYQDEIPDRYEFVSYESVLEKNPDVIFIIDIQSRPQTIEEKMEIFKTDPVLKATNAVKNNQIYEVNLAEVTPGVRNVNFIIRMNKILYQDKK